ncbi:MAG TPA: hypothetical protein VMR80_02610 [Candidatus Acidoferrum sp.]|nr:hypothetical protein [Candidatus Acidoferrum sp.]
MIEKRERVQGTLPVSDGALGIGRAAVTAGIGHDQCVVAGQLVATGVHPVFVAAGAAVQKQERSARAVDLVKHFNAVERHGSRLHNGILAPGGERNKLVDARAIIYIPATARS